METMGKRINKRKKIFIGKMSLLIFCAAFISFAQNNVPHNIVISTMADLNDTSVSTVHAKQDIRENADKYPFHCGDAVGILVAPDTASFLKGEYIIDDDGCINLPIIGRKRITAMTQEELTSYLKNAFVQYLRYPGVQVQPLIRLELMGGFQRPGFYYISPHAAFWDVFHLAGAPVREDGLEKIKLLRSHITIDFDPVRSIEIGQSLKQMGIQSGDQIMVTARPLKTKWDSFKDDVLPILSLTLSLAATTATAYISYETYKGGR
jgi:hypothetical protein